MKNKQVFIIFLIFGCSYTAFAQLDSIQNLDEVVLSDIKLSRYASGYKITVLNDSIIEKNQWSLTSLLRFNSTIYFKENGYGMVSSPSFRGTNASQTAVIWNGININSQLNGQVDFNTINTSNYNSVEIRSGGGGVQYGSGAIGGTVHLSNQLKFQKHTNHKLGLGYGSFETKNLNYGFSKGTNRWSVDAAVTYVDSENNYKYLGTGKTNINGEFDNLSVNFNAGYLLNDKNVLKLYHQTFYGNRQFSGTLVAPSKNKYEDKNYRSLLEWVFFNKNYSSKIKFAHLLEEFKFFENKDSDRYSLGRVNSFIANHNFDLKINKTLDLRTILEASKYIGEGDSFGNPSRENFSATALLKHQLTERFIYGINIRKDFTTDFNSPLVFAMDVDYRLTNFYSWKFNVSKNYRVPTFNDLFWQPGGNLNLVPESSYQIDFGQALAYKFASARLNGYYIRTKDMIQWVPDNRGLFRPQNINEVVNYGLEVELELKNKIGEHFFNLSSNYSYTISENEATKKQLIYVPFHKINLNFGYAYKNFEFTYQHLFNGEVSIIGGQLDGFNVDNLGVSCIIPWSKVMASTINFNLNNLYNTAYQNVALRPMPNRNYQLQLTLNF